MVATVGQAQNLIKDPSFENTKPRDRWGLVFSDWRGWIYAQPAEFRVGRIGRTGNTSCEIKGGRNCKIRLQSQPMELEPGRYRMRAYIRGLDIGPGKWRRPNDFSVWFDDKFPNLKKSGTFGWTPLTYVFDLPQGAKKPVQLFFGLMAGGRMWVDDVALEKVDESVALTPEPLFGEGEGPITMPRKIEKLQRCGDCGYRNDASWEGCYACGHELAEAQAKRYTTPALKVFADFEDGKPAPFGGSNIQVVNEHASHGTRALCLEQKWADLTAPQDWAEHDFLHFDVYNPSPESVPLTVEVRDEATKGYWTRVNANTVAPPGRSTVTMPTQLYVGEKSRPGRPLIRDKITRFVVAIRKGGPVFLDYFRLERLDTEKMKFDGLAAFDFGPPGSPLMEGFESADSSTQYSPGRGYGWHEARLWRAFDARQPEVLTQDFVCPEAGAFRYDLPDGRYRVLMIIESPGGYWGEVQKFKQREVLINGETALQESMTIDSWKKHYFRHAGVEDRPGLDAFSQYALPVLKWRSFDAVVTDGRLDIGFKGANWAICLSAMVVYPQDKGEQGQAFIDWANKRRRAHFENYFKQVVPPAEGQAGPDTGYALFSRHLMAPPGANDGPKTGEAIDLDRGLSVTAAKGERTALTFSIQPGKQDLGTIDVMVSALTSQNDAKLPESTIRAGWLDYRISRVNMDGSVWTVRPRYWHPTPAPAAPGVTRTFWLRIGVPDNVAPGRYAGRVTVRPADAEPTSFPLAVTVLPFALDPVTDVAVGPWGSGMSLWWFDGPESQAWRWEMYDKALDALRDAGCTSFSGRPRLRVTARNGKVQLDAAAADREMALARQKGFSHLVSNYGAGSSLGYRAYGTGSGPDVTAAKRAGFSSMDSFLKALYGAIDRHAVASNWLPVAWNLCDEPIGGNIPPAVKNAQAHRAALDGLERTTFMGATSMRGDDPKDPHYELVKALPLPSLNLHDEKSLSVIEEAGNRFSFYNGGDRWTYGRYLKMLVIKHRVALRLTWHFNISAGDPYYALDCREDDYCWYNTDAEQTMVPSLRFLSEILPGLNDYRYLSTLQRLFASKASHPAAPAAKRTLDAMMALVAGGDRWVGRDRRNEGRLGEYDADRKEVADAILALLETSER